MTENDDLIDEGDVEIELEIQDDGTILFPKEIRDKLKLMGMVELEVIDQVLHIRPVTVH